MIHKEFDRSFRSIQFLRNKCEDFFSQELNTENLYFPDDITSRWNDLDKDKLIDIILFGSAIRALLESSFWTGKNCRLWVLCASAKKVLVDNFQLDPQQVAILPRHLFYKNEQLRDEVAPLSEMKFFYGGRLNSSKNIETLIYVIHELQNITGKPISLKLFGEFDDQEKIMFGEEKKKIPFSSKVDHLINELQWLKSPEIITGFNQGEWIHEVEKGSTFISLSTNVFEDFGVSALQAQERGFSCILSSWGGHLEARGNVMAIPWDYLPQFNENKLKGKMIAHYIVNNKFMKNDRREALSLPCEVSLKSLGELRKEFIHRLGEEALYLSRENWNMFYRTVSGINFMNAYRRHFYGELSSNYSVLITNDFFNDNKMNDIVMGLDEKQLNEREGLILYSYYELISSDVIKNILQAKKVYSLISREDLINSFKQFFNIISEKEMIFLSK